MNAIFLFDNFFNASQEFQKVHLEPRLKDAGILGDTRIEFQDYRDRNLVGSPPLQPEEVAQQFSQRWDSLEVVPEKTAFVLDLDPFGGNTPDPSFGLCVLNSLATEVYGMGAQGFLAHRTFLVSILTLFPEELLSDNGINRLQRHRCDLSILSRVWPSVRKVQNENRSRIEPSEISRAVRIVNQPESRIVFALGRTDDEWCADVITEWLKS